MKEKRRLPLEPDPERDARAEIGFYLEERTRELEAGGMDHEEAVRAARAAFGNPERVAVQVAAIDGQRRRDEGRGWRMETIARETRQAARALARRPTFTAVVVLTLALGIGAVTAVFSVVNASLIRSLPFADAEGLVVLQGAFDAPDGPQIRGASPLEARDWESLSSSFEEAAAYDSESFTLTGAGVAERLTGEVIDHGYFELLRVDALAGRLPAAEEYERGSSRVVVLGEALWTRVFGADRAIVGRAIQLSGNTFTVVGIVPASFRGMTFTAELWVPLPAAGYTQGRGNRSLGTVAARLLSGVTVERARQDLAGVTDRLEAEYPDINRDRIALVTPLRELYLGSTRTLMLVIQSAAALLLLIASINVSNLLLVRASARAPEVLMRRALGAGRSALVRHLVIESLLLAGAGAAGGLALGVWGADLLAGAMPDALLPSWIDVAPDARVFLLVAAVMGTIGILVGLLPALLAGRTDLATGLRERGAGARTAGQAPLQRLLVVGEVALALVLLVGAGLMVRSLGAQLEVDPGFEPDGLFAARVELPLARYQKEARLAAGAALLERVAGQPGVASVTLASDAPLRDRANASYMWMAPGGTVEDRLRFYVHAVDPSYFSTMGTDLSAGETFAPGSEQVVVISRALAARHFPGQDPIGRSLWLFDSADEPVTIVGVAEDIRHRDLTTDLVTGPSDPDVYLPWAALSTTTIELIVRAAGDPAALVPVIREAVRAVDADLPPFAIAPLADGLRKQTAQARFGSLLLSGFSVLAALLAAVGLYGVLSFAVAGRAREIAVRIAVGADRGQVRGMVVADGLKLTAVGLALGALAATAGARSLSAFLYGVGPLDLPTYLAVAALMTAVAALASWIPALRATRVDPNQALSGG